MDLLNDGALCSGNELPREYQSGLAFKDDTYNWVILLYYAKAMFGV